MTAYRFTTHRRPEVDLISAWCPWSGVSVVDPADWAVPGNRRCPSGCPTSDVEIDPTAPADDECDEGDRHVCGDGLVCAVCARPWPCDDADLEACERCGRVGAVDAVCGLCPRCEANNAGRVVL